MFYYYDNDNKIESNEKDINYSNADNNSSEIATDVMTNLTKKGTPTKRKNGIPGMKSTSAIAETTTKIIEPTETLIGWRNSWNWGSQIGS